MSVPTVNARLRRMNDAVRVGFVTAVMTAMVIMAVVPTARAGEIRAAAGPIPLDEVLKPLKAPFERATGTTLSLRDADFADSLRDLMKGALDVVASSLPVEDALRELKDQGVHIDRSSIQTAVIATVPVSVVVGKGSSLNALSKEQLKGVFTGKIQNWKDVGGNVEAVRIIRPWGYPIASAFQYGIMDGEDYASGMIDSLGWEEARKAVVEIPDSITILPASLVDGSVKVLETPEIVQSLMLVTKGTPSGALRTFIEFAGGEGKKYLAIKGAR